MKNFRNKITLLLSFLVLFNFVSMLVGANLNQYNLISLEFDSNTEISNSENETESEGKLKNFGFWFSYYNLNSILKSNKDFAFSRDIFSNKNHIIEVPTSPPNNC